MTTSKIHIFFHCYADNHWEGITRSLLPFVHHQRIHCTLIGEDIHESKLLQIAGKYNIELEIRRFADPHTYEHEVMKWIKSNATLHPEDWTLYFHTKGAANPTDLNDRWRGFMIAYFLSKWRTILKKMIKSSRDAAGLWYGFDDADDELKGIESQFFAGNFWMAKNAYLAGLPEYDSLMDKFDGSRYLPERYIGFENPSVLFLNQRSVLPVKGENGVQWQIIKQCTEDKATLMSSFILKIKRRFFNG